MIFIRYNQEKEDNLIQLSDAIRIVSERFHRTLKKVNEMAEKELELDNPQNVEYLESMGISVSDLKKAIEELRSDGYISYRHVDKFFRAYRWIKKPSKRIVFFSKELWLADIVREDWDEELVPYVIEVLCLIDKYKRDERLKTLIYMYIADKMLLEQTMEMSQYKYALIIVAIEYCGGIIDSFSNNVFSNEEVERIISKANNRPGLEEEIENEFEKFLALKLAEKEANENALSNLLSEEYNKHDAEAANELFNSYFEKIIQPLFFDLHCYGHMYLSPQYEKITPVQVIDELNLPDSIDAEVAEYMIENSIRALEEDRGEEYTGYNCFWIWGSKRYFEIINRLNDKGEQLQAEDKQNFNHIVEWIKDLSKDTDTTSLESLAIFGAKYTFLYYYYVEGKKDFYVMEYLEKQNTNIKALIKEYQVYEKAIRDADLTEHFDFCRASYKLNAIINWHNFFVDLHDFELHGLKNEKRYKSLYNRAKHCYNTTR